MDIEGVDLASGEAVSYARPNAGHLPTRWQVSIHPGMLNDLVVLHELAHCIAPRWSLSLKRRRAGQLPSHARHRAHGAGFAGAMAELVGEFGDGAVHDELRVAYNHFDVSAMTLDEYREAVRQSLVAEQDLTRAQQEWATSAESKPRPEPPPGGWRIPEWLWGETIRNARHHAGRVGMDRLAGIVSQIERCTRTDIRAVENSKDLPENIRSRRIAMCMAVALGLDPIYMRHQMGLTRWECGIELDDLKAINPGWVDLVNTMNQQLAERPPKWLVDGDR